MSKKNKNIKTYDLDSVFDEYMLFLADFNKQKENYLSLEIEKLTDEIKEDKEALLTLQATITKIEAMEKEISKISILSTEKRAKLEEDLKKDEERFYTLRDKLEQLKNPDKTLMPAKEADKLAEKIQKTSEALNKANEKLSTLQAKLEADDKNKQILAEKKNEINFLTKQLYADEENFESFDLDPIASAKESLNEFYGEIIEKESALKQLKAEHEKVSGEPVADLESFKKFLEENGLSTAHAEDLFKHRHNPERFEKIAYADFKMRKMHPKRDYIIKKVVVPAAITSTAIGATIGAIAGSGLVGGSVVMGVIPVSGTPGLTQMATTMTGAAVGLASTPIVIKSKNLITRTYYKLRAKSAFKNLEDYEDGTDIENLSISKLVEKIQNTQHKILESKGPKHMVLKTINRNRIHQVEAYTKQLFEQYKTIEADKTLSKKVKNETLKPIYELLANIEEFIANDIAESKTHSMLTCKEKKNHHHKYLIENVDIYANLKIYIDRLARVNAEQDNRAEMLKNAKKTTKNLAQKKKEAYNIVYSPKIITSKLSQEYKSPVSQPIALLEKPKTRVIKDVTPVPKNETKVEPKTETKVETKKAPNFAPTPEVKVTGVGVNATDGTIYLDLENGKEIKLPAGSIDTNKEIATAKEGKNKYSITYADGTKQEIIKKAKVLPEIETARHVLGALLHNEKFINNLKNQGYQAQTINALKQRLTDWIANPTQKLVLSGKVKELYAYSMEGINAQAKDEMNIGL